MADRDGIFAGEDPFELTQAWLADAKAAGALEHDAATLTSVDASGMPNMRILYMRNFEPDAFIFYTNYTSAKGQELEGAGKAAFLYYWPELKRQIRVRGLVERVSPEISDAYFNARPAQSRVGAWASHQSQPLADRAELEARLEAEAARLGDAPPRPPHWGGYRIRPLEFEFWSDGAFRLHDRFRWSREKVNDLWKIERLNP